MAVRVLHTRWGLRDGSRVCPLWGGPLSRAEGFLRATTGLRPSTTERQWAGTLGVISPLKALEMGKQNARSQKRSGGKRGGNRKQTAKLSPVPNAYITRMGFYGNYNIQEVAAGTGAFTTFALTNLYDPDYTGVGTQPISFDQWSTLYARFRVVSVRMELWVVNNTNVVTETGWVASTAPILPATINAWPCQRVSGSRPLSINTGGQATCVFNKVFKPWELMSLTKAQYMSEADYSHTSSAGPSRNCYLNVWCIGMAGLANIRAGLRLFYDVELSEPLNLATS